MTKRPKYLNLLKIHLPITGVLSILHRITGVMLFLSIPLLIMMLQDSLKNEASFLQLVNFLQHPVFILIFFILLLSFSHHFFAGIRFLLMDIEWGMDKFFSRKTAWFSLLLGVVIATLLMLGFYQ